MAARLPPPGRGKRKPLEAKTPAQRRAAMAGFCSCKTGIHAIPGNNLGSAPQTGIRSFRSQLTPLTYIPVGEIDIETCDRCDGTVKVIACIEDPAIVKRILDHLEQRPDSNTMPTHPARARPPAAQRDGS